MNIILDKQSNTLATLKVQLVQEDYQAAVDKKLKDYKKQANFKGFRPGMVPLDMVKKMYGKAILAEEINQKLGHTVNDYIKENKINIVGEPIPVQNDQVFDWDTATSFNFDYTLGIAGDFEVNFDKLPSVDQLDIVAGEKELEDTIEGLKKQFAEQAKGETVENDDMVFGVFTQGEWTEKSAIPLKAIKDAEKKIFLGAKIGDTLNFEIENVFVDQKSLALATGKKEDEVADLKGTTTFTIEDITRQTPATIDQDFFDRVLGPEKATTEAEFRKQLLDIITDNYKREAEYLLKIDAEKAVIENIKIELPDEFLKNWLIDINQDKFTAEEVEKDFDNVKKDIRWSLIKNKIAETEDIKVEYTEVLEKTKEMVRGQFGMYNTGDTDSMNEVIDKIANNYLQEKAKDGQSKFTQMFNAVFADKISDVLTSKIKVNKKTVDVDGFKEIVEKIKQ